MTNSKRKGKRGELEACKAIETLWGTHARRTAQVDGGLSADILLKDLPDFHVEVKRRTKIAALRFMDQAIRDLGQRRGVPIVVMREDGGTDWVVMLRLKDVPEFAFQLEHRE